jgi:hypothetical protein
LPRANKKDEGRKEKNKTKLPERKKQTRQA